MSEVIEHRGMGWLPDYPDFRDQTIEYDKLSKSLQNLGQKDSVKAMLSKVGIARRGKAMPALVDLRPWFSPVEDQGNLGSCTAHAGVGIVEYFEKRAFGKHIDASRLFLYKVTRSLIHSKGDTGAFLRSTMGALVLFGVPPEEYWPYKVADFDKEPSSFCYAFGQNYQAMSYYRLDPPGTDAKALLTQIRTNLAAGSALNVRLYSIQLNKSG